MEPITIASAIAKYLDNISLVRSPHTAQTYKNATNHFQNVLRKNKLDPITAPASALTEDGMTWFARYLKDFSPATEQLYIHAVKGFYEYLAADRLSDINLPRLRLLIRQRVRRPGIRLPQFPMKSIDDILAYIANPDAFSGKKEIERLRALRDRAFLMTLADTGLRVHEACKLRPGDIDWNEGRAVIIGKGDKQAVVRFSSRSMNAIKDYLSVRAEKDGQSGKPLAALPLFARHDKGAGNRIKAITTTSGRNIVKERVQEILGAEAKGKITPHSFRHYFVTAVLRGSGNLKLAQELARHSNIQVTQRYAHLSDDELDKGYYDIFEKSK